MNKVLENIQARHGAFGEKIRSQYRNVWMKPFKEGAGYPSGQACWSMTYVSVESHSACSLAFANEVLRISLRTKAGDQRPHISDAVNRNRRLP